MVMILANYKAQVVERASRLPNGGSRGGVYVSGPDSGIALASAVCCTRLAFPAQHGGHRRTNPNGGRKNSHNDGEKGVDTGFDEKARSR